MKFKKVCIFLLLLPFSYLYSLEIPDRPIGRVSDYAKILKPEEISTLERILSNYEKETTNQIVIAIFKSLEGWDIEDFSVRLAEKWKIGQKGKDNGIIILVALAERKVRIEVGYGLEGVVPDITARQIIDREIVPFFRKSDYFNGLMNGVDSLIKAIGGEYKTERSDGDEFIIPILAFIFITIIGLLIRFLSTFASYTYSRSKGRWHRRYSIWDSFWGGFFGGWSSGGWGSGGGFSGGGGSFGGGGATGSW